MQQCDSCRGLGVDVSALPDIVTGLSLRDATGLYGPCPACEDREFVVAPKI